ncbi:cold-shock protein [Alicyclobacillus macrosporangiidus]|uniref:cold-shock protein n=1 Tax=Alicyclobacillus macrosporangiidus TaxID=392015 RepID=UPI002481DA32|nr:cold shock domain-containing protein [Alicyclobacillus macrosporangiidus]
MKWYKEDKGYGRIMLDGQDGNHVFVHYTEIRPDTVRFPTGFRFLKEGQKVSFILVEKPHANDSQRLTATDVEILAD